MDVRDFYRRIVLENCEKAMLTGESTPESTDSPEFRAVLNEFKREGTIYMYDSKNGRIPGPCKVIAGFTEKGKRVYMPYGKLLDAYRLKKPDQAASRGLNNDKGHGDEKINCSGESVFVNKN